MSDTANKSNRVLI